MKALKEFLADLEIYTLIFQTNAVEQLLWRWQCDKPNNGVGAKKAAAAISGR